MIKNKNKKIIVNLLLCYMSYLLTINLNMIVLSKKKIILKFKTPISILQKNSHNNIKIILMKPYKK
jgi:hypothetical protein